MLGDLHSVHGRSVTALIVTINDPDLEVSDTPEPRRLNTTILSLADWWTAHSLSPNVMEIALLPEVSISLLSLGLIPAPVKTNLPPRISPAYMTIIGNLHLTYSEIWKV